MKIPHLVPILACAALFHAAFAAPGATTPGETSFLDEQSFVTGFMSRAEALRKEGKLVPLANLADKSASSEPIEFLPPLTEKAAPADLAERLRQSVFAMGLYYRCHNCSEWHFSVGTGFATAKGGILSTCAHVIEFQPTEMREAFPIAIDSNGKVYPIVKILAYDPVADTALVKVDGANRPPLPVKGSARVGEPVYCLAHPNSHYFLFTTGVISRAVKVQAGDRTVRSYDVSCEYSPGSSGGAIVDACGNVVAQVNTIESQFLEGGEEGQKNPPLATVFNLRTANAASEILRLADPSCRLPMPPPPKPEPPAPKEKPKKNPKAEGEKKS